MHVDDDVENDGLPNLVALVNSLEAASIVDAAVDAMNVHRVGHVVASNSDDDSVVQLLDHNHLVDIHNFYSFVPVVVDGVAFVADEDVSSNNMVEYSLEMIQESVDDVVLVVVYVMKVGHNFHMLIEYVVVVVGNEEAEVLRLVFHLIMAAY